MINTALADSSTQDQIDKLSLGRVPPYQLFQMFYILNYFIASIYSEVQSQVTHIYSSRSPHILFSAETRTFLSLTKNINFIISDGL